LHDLALLWQVRALIAAGDVALLHAHNVEAPILSWLAGGGRVPVVYNLHTEMREELPSYASLPSALMRGVGGMFDTMACRFATAGVAPSNNGRDVLRSHGVANTVVATPGVDLASLAGADAARARTRWALGDRRWAVYAGNLDGYQDIEVLMQAMARLPDAGLMVVTGSGTSIWRARASAMGIRSENLRWIETKDFDEVKDALAAATVGVLPRVTCAGFPIKLLNQMALGLPTIATQTAVDDMPSVVRVPPRDAEALSRVIASFLSGARDIQSLRAQARRVAGERYGWDVAIRPVIDLYESLDVFPQTGGVHL
jgi:glycosyltransferase involved in cell wall biosynthesis